MITKKFLGSAVDFALCSLYLFCNPFRVCRKFFQKKGESEIHMYGETSFSAWEKIAVAVGLKEDDHFLDLGCGRGRLCFWNSLIFGCRSTGVDWVPKFISRARFITSLLRISNVQFFCKSLSAVSLKEATVVYLYTYHPEEGLVDFSELPEGARVITVSEPLRREDFVLDQELSVEYPWGVTEVYLARKCKKGCGSTQK